MCLRAKRLCFTRIRRGIKFHLVADYSVFSLLTLEPDTDDCKLYNYYDAQSCSVASIGILLGSLICFFGK